MTDDIYRMVNALSIVTHYPATLFALAIPSFVFAQLCWALAYFHFKKFA